MSSTRQSELFDAEETNGLPDAVLKRACELYDAVRDQPLQIGASDVVDGYWVETHTLGCRNAGDDPEEEWWDKHYEFFDKYSEDGVSVVGGDPSDGVFVTVTPQLSLEAGRKDGGRESDEVGFTP